MSCSFFNKSPWVSTVQVSQRHYQSEAVYWLQTRALSSYRRCYVSVLTHPKIENGEKIEEEEHVTFKPHGNTLMLLSLCTWMKHVQRTERSRERSDDKGEIKNGSDKRCSFHPQTKKYIPKGTSCTEVMYAFKWSIIIEIPARIQSQDSDFRFWHWNKQKKLFWHWKPNVS